MLDLPLRDDLGQDRVGGTDSLAAGIAQRERERSGDIVGIGGMPCVVTISITIAAFEAISATLPDGSEAFPPQIDERGGVQFIVDRKTWID